jgi:hypothetical protein
MHQSASHKPVSSKPFPNATFAHPHNTGTLDDRGEVMFRRLSGDLSTYATWVHR